MQNDSFKMQNDIFQMQKVNGIILEQQLYQYAGKTLGFISTAYESLTFSPLNSGPYQLELYLTSILSTSTKNVLGKNISFDWIKDYKHPSFKGKYIPLEDYNFNLVTKPIHSPDGLSGPNVVIGEVKVEGNIYHLARGIHQCAQLACLVLEMLRKFKKQHHDLKDDPRLNVSFFLFVICGYLHDIPRKFLKAPHKLSFNELAKELNLDPALIEVKFSYSSDFTNPLWGSYLFAKYDGYNLIQMYHQKPPNYNIINAFALFLIVFVFGVRGGMNIAFVEGKL